MTSRAGVTAVRARLRGLATLLVFRLHGFHVPEHVLQGLLFGIVLRLLGPLRKLFPQFEQDIERPIDLEELLPNAFLVFARYGRSASRQLHLSQRSIGRSNLGRPSLQTKAAGLTP